MKTQKRRFHHTTAMKKRNIERTKGLAKLSREELLEKNIGLVHQIVNEDWIKNRAYYEKLGMDRFDMEQEAKISLFKVLDRFDPNKGFAFSSWAGAVLKNHLKSFRVKARAEKRRAPTDSVDEIIRLSEDEGNLVPESMIIHHEAKQFIESEQGVLKADLLAAINGIKLNPKWRLVILDLFGINDGKRKKEEWILKKYGIHNTARLWQIKQEVFKKMRMHPRIKHYERK